MKAIKQLKKLQAILDADTRARYMKRDKLKNLLCKMKSKEKHLARKINDTRDSKEKSRLEQEVALLHTQRKKGLKALKKLRESDAS